MKDAVFRVACDFCDAVVHARRDQLRKLGWGKIWSRRARYAPQVECDRCPACTAAGRRPGRPHGA